MTMRVYVAGKNVQRAKRVMQHLLVTHYTVSFDWTLDLQNEHAETKALTEWQAIRASDAVIHLWESDQRSALYETGMAMGLGIPVIVIGECDEWFHALPHVRRVETENQAYAVLSDHLANKDFQKGVNRP